MKVSAFPPTCLFYKKLGSGHSTKSFLIGFLFFECSIINVVAVTAADMFLDVHNII